jgi:ABC-type transport system involved in multi-copper enzyme maturation permease subunit
VRAATCISSERERKTWDSLLLTPLGAGEVLWGKLLGCLFSVRRVWLLVGLLWALGGTSGQIGLGSLVASLLLTTVLALCAATVGLLLSLRLKTSVQALAAALALSLFLSGGYLLLGLPLLLSAGSGPPPWLLCPCVPFLLVSSMLLGVDNPPGADQLLAACAMGGVLYGVLWLVLLAIVWRRFDRWAGRGRPSAVPRETAAGLLGRLAVRWPTWRLPR